MNPAFFPPQPEAATMATFTIRVEILDRTAPDAYRRLDLAMTQAGFEPTITDTAQGGTFRLPTGEYNFVADLTPAKVLKRACRVATGSGLRCAVLVTESVGRTWSNLRGS